MNSPPRLIHTCVSRNTKHRRRTRHYWSRKCARALENKKGVMKNITFYVYKSHILYNILSPRSESLFQDFHLVFSIPREIILYRQMSYAFHGVMYLSPQPGNTSNSHRVKRKIPPSHKKFSLGNVVNVNFQSWPGVIILKSTATEAILFLLSWGISVFSPGVINFGFLLTGWEILGFFNKRTFVSGLLSAKRGGCFVDIVKSSNYLEIALNLNNGTLKPLKPGRVRPDHIPDYSSWKRLFKWLKVYDSIIHTYLCSRQSARVSMCGQIVLHLWCLYESVVVYFPVRLPKPRRRAIMNMLSTKSYLSSMLQNSTITVCLHFFIIYFTVKKRFQILFKQHLRFGT